MKKDKDYLVVYRYKEGGFFGDMSVLNYNFYDSSIALLELNINANAKYINKSIGKIESIEVYEINKQIEVDEPNQYRLRKAN